MHKPARPKSAKGHSRTTHPVVDRGERKSSTSTTSVFSRSGPQAQHNGPGSTSLAYQHSETATSLRNPAACSKTNQNFNLKGSAEAKTTQSSSARPDILAQGEIQEEVKFPAIDRPTSSLSKYHILPAISPPALNSHTDVSHTGGSMQPGSPAENEVDLLTEKAQQMILDSALQRMGPKTKTPPNGGYKRKVSKGVEFDRKRAKVYQTKSVFASSGASRPEKPRVPREPGPNEESLLIALKLPDGTRKERRFLPNTTLQEILVYAHTQYPIIPVSQCNVFRMDTIPKKLLSELGATLQGLKIQHRTVLYIEENEDW
uniref:UBX domain-containing protein 10-like n=1 Tax=Phallusia mammillata TaxID=59560 RepID=A0A6F9DWR2_9ASCI|nr:UBX domain-containing protein 10-like [Phallusia mammillata]